MHGRGPGADVLEVRRDDVAPKDLVSQQLSSICRPRTCPSWAACDAELARQCRCEYYKGDRYCFDEDWAPLDGGGGGWTRWYGMGETYPVDVNLKWLGDWWRLNHTSPAGFLRTLNDTFIANKVDDDKWLGWAACASKHTLQLHGSPIGGWQGAKYTVFKCVSNPGERPSENKCLNLVQLQEGTLEQESDFVEFFLCPDDQHVFQVTMGGADQDLKWKLYDTYGEEIIHGTFCSYCVFYPWVFTKREGAVVNYAVSESLLADDCNSGENDPYQAWCIQAVAASDDDGENDAYAYYAEYYYQDDDGLDYCVDTNDGVTDADGNSCTEYSTESATGYGSGVGNWCGNYDDSDFSANAMCCACGGGCGDSDDGATDAYDNGCSVYSTEAATGWSSGYGNWCGNYDDSDFSANDMCCACDGGCSPPCVDSGAYGYGNGRRRLFQFDNTTTPTPAPTSNPTPVPVTPMPTTTSNPTPAPPDDRGLTLTDT